MTRAAPLTPGSRNRSTPKFVRRIVSLTVAVKSAWQRRRRKERLAFFGDEDATDVDLTGTKLGEVWDDDEIGAVTWRDGAAVREAKILCRIEARHLDRAHGVKSISDSQPDDMIQFAQPQQIMARLVVGDEAGALRVMFQYHRQQGLQVAHRALAREKPHPEANLLQRFVRRNSLVVRLHARRHIATQIQTYQPWSMPIHRHAARPRATGLAERDHVEHRLVPGDDGGIVHHLADRGDAHVRGEVAQVVRAQGRAIALELARRDTGGQCEEEVYGHMLGGGKRPAQAVQPAHVGDLVRVADARGRAMWRHCARELAGSQQRALDMGMRLDETLARDTAP